jgi:hypothetical protein
VLLLLLLLAVRFMEPQWAPPELQQRILSHMNAWGCSITFALVSEATALYNALSGGPTPHLVCIC